MEDKERDESFKNWLFYGKGLAHLRNFLIYDVKLSEGQAKAMIECFKGHSVTKVAVELNIMFNTANSILHIAHKKFEKFFKEHKLGVYNKPRSLNAFLIIPWERLIDKYLMDGMPNHTEQD